MIRYLLLFASVGGIAFALGILGAPVWVAAIILGVILLTICVAAR